MPSWCWCPRTTRKWGGPSPARPTRNLETVEHGCHFRFTIPNLSTKERSWLKQIRAIQTDPEMMWPPNLEDFCPKDEPFQAAFNLAIPHDIVTIYSRAEGGLIGPLSRVLQAFCTTFNHLKFKVTWSTADLNYRTDTTLYSGGLLIVDDQGAVSATLGDLMCSSSTSMKALIRQVR